MSMTMRAAALRPALAMRASLHARSFARLARPSAMGSRLRAEPAIPSSLLLRRAAATYATDSKAGPPPPGKAPPQAPPPPTQGEGNRFGMKNSTLFTVLIGVGLLMTIYGVLEWWYALQIWPQSVRDPLKKALKARNKGDYETSNQYFNEALKACYALHPGDLDPDPLLKVSGIYITQATMLEEAGYPLRAYVQLYKALRLFGPRPLAAVPPPTGGWAGNHALSPPEIHRAIGLAQKLGSLAAGFGAMRNPPAYPEQALRDVDEADGAPQDSATEVDASRVPPNWNKAAEHFLSAALASMLRIGLGETKPYDGDAKEQIEKHGQFSARKPVIAGRDVVLPQDGEDDIEYGGRVSRRGLGITMETLAEVYARDKRYDLAGQLLLQTLSILIPFDNPNHSSSDLCQAAQVMTNISAYAIEPRATDPTGKKRQTDISKSWSERALKLVDEVKEKEGWKDGAPRDHTQALCARAQSVAQYNLGMLAEMMDDAETASTYFAQAAETARMVGFNEGYREARRAHKRIKSVLLPPSDAEVMSG